MAAVRNCQRLLLLRRVSAGKSLRLREWRKFLPQQTRLAGKLANAIAHLEPRRPATRCRLTSQSFWLQGMRPSKL